MTGAVLAVAALAVALFAQTALASVAYDQIVWHLPGSKASYWNLNSNGTIKNSTRNDGWGDVGSAGGAWWLRGIHLNGNGSNNQLLWQNTSSGATAYWNLNTNGVKKNETQNDGWGKIHPNNVDPSYAIVGVLYNQDGQGTNKLQLYSQTTRKALYWTLNTNGAIKNLTRNDGWGWTDGAGAAMGSGWYIAGVQLFADTQLHNSGNTHLIWRNSSSGKIVYWKLNSNGMKKNETQNDGWGYIATGCGSAWRLAGVHYNVDRLGKQNLVFQNTANGAVNYWTMNSNGVQKNTTQNDGWGSVGAANGWNLAAIQANGSTNTDHMLFVNRNNGKSVAWRLNSNGVQKNNTQNDGWIYLNGGATQGTTWRIGAINTTAPIF